MDEKNTSGDAAAARDEIKRAGLSFAHGGVTGLALWLSRDHIRAFLVRHLDGRMALIIMGCALGLVVLANYTGIEVFRMTGLAALLLTPLLWRHASDERLKEDAWALEHGRDTAAIDAARSQDRRRRDEAAFADDWVVFPENRDPSSSNPAPAPRFGRKE